MNPSLAKELGLLPWGAAPECPRFYPTAQFRAVLPTKKEDFGGSHTAGCNSASERLRQSLLGEKNLSCNYKGLGKRIRETRFLSAICINGVLKTLLFGPMYFSKIVKLSGIYL